MPPEPNGVGKSVTGDTLVAIDEVLAVGEEADVRTAELDVVVDVAGVLCWRLLLLRYWRLL